MDVFPNGSVVDKQVNAKKIVDEILITPTENTTAYSLGVVLKSLGEECDNWKVKFNNDGSRGQAFVVYVEK